jgi:glutathione S-transferase
MIEYVELADAKAAGGVRMVASGFVPSPWGEAAKGLFRVAGVPVKCVRSLRNQPDLVAWTGIDNVPVVLYGDEPPRACWAAITGLASRLAGPDVLLPADPRKRAQHMGLIEMIAGEDGLAWSARASMVAGNGFPAPVNARLAGRYVGPADEARVAAHVAVLRDHLAEQHALGHAYLAGARVGALDIYLATALTPLSELDDAACPKMLPALRAAFGVARATFAHLVPPELFAHRALVMERHLGWPIEI